MMLDSCRRPLDLPQCGKPSARRICRRSRMPIRIEPI